MIGCIKSEQTCSKCAKMKLLFSILSLVVVSALAGPSRNGRIVGGQPSDIGSFPSIAALEITKENSRIFCQGVLLNRIWLLTVAHCAANATLITAHLGVVHLSDPNGVKTATDTFILHPSYDSLTLANDLALIKLHLPISFTDYIQPVSLPINDVGQANSLIIAGWGQVDDDKPAPVNELHQVEVALLSDAECRRTYGNAIQPSMICVEGSYNEGACRGDSGAPLYDVTNPLRTIIDGLSSFISSKGCESTDPSGFTKIYPFLSWINSHINN